MQFGFGGFFHLLDLRVPLSSFDTDLPCACVHVCACVCVCQADEETIVAALLHDIGWLVPKPQDASLLTSSDESVND